MKSCNTILTLALLTLLGSAGLAWSADTVVASGDPPLTQTTLDKATNIYLWILDIGLTDLGRKASQQLLLKEWQANDQHIKKEVLRDAGYWDQLVKMKEAAQLEYRAREQPKYLGFLRGADARESEKYLLAAYEEVYKVLVEGPVPLTQAMVWQQSEYLEWVLDVKLTSSERQQLQKFMVQAWETTGKEAREGFRLFIANESKTLSKFNGYQKRHARAQMQPGFLEDVRKKARDGYSRWLLDVYEASHKVGGKRNAVLVEGDPALTQRTVDHFWNMGEWVLDLSLSGGLSEQQRQVLQPHFLQQWKGLTKAQKNDLVKDMLDWEKAAGKMATMSKDQRNQLRQAVQLAVLARLRASRDDVIDQALLEAYNREQKLVQEQIELVKHRHAVQMQMEQYLYEARKRAWDGIGRAMTPEGRWEYNPTTRRRDRWVPYR